MLYVQRSFSEFFRGKNDVEVRSIKLAEPVTAELGVSYPLSAGHSS